MTLLRRIVLLEAVHAPPLGDGLAALLTYVQRYPTPPDPEETAPDTGLHRVLLDARQWRQEHQR